MTIILANLSDDLQRFIEMKVAEEGYSSAEEYVRALLQREVAASPQSETSTASAQELRERELAFQEQLVAGLLAEVKLPPPATQEETFQPIRIKGAPLSQMVIEDRR